MSFYQSLFIRYHVLKLLHELHPRQGTRALEMFLRAFYQSFLLHRQEPLTHDLFVTMLRDGFYGAPADYRPEWEIRYVAKPEGYWWWRMQPIPQQFQEKLTTISEEDLGREQTEQMLLFQITDLHLTSNQNLEDIERFLGGNSARGHTWQHTNLFDCLDLASQTAESPLTLGEGIEVWLGQDIHVIYMEQPLAELDRLEKAYPFDNIMTDETPIMHWYNILRLLAYMMEAE